MAQVSCFLEWWKTLGQTKNRLPLNLSTKSHSGEVALGRDPMAAMANSTGSGLSVILAMMVSVYVPSLTCDAMNSLAKKHHRTRGSRKSLSALHF